MIKSLITKIESKYTKIKCKLGFHSFGKFFKDGWIPPILGCEKECRSCSRCGHFETRTPITHRQ